MSRWLRSVFVVVPFDSLDENTTVRIDDLASERRHGVVFIVLVFDCRTNRVSGPDKRRDERQTFDEAEDLRTLKTRRLAGSA